MGNRKTFVCSPRLRSQTSPPTPSRGELLSARPLHPPNPFQAAVSDTRASGGSHNPRRLPQQPVTAPPPPEPSPSQRWLRTGLLGAPRGRGAQRAETRRARGAAAGAGGAAGGGPGPRGAEPGPEGGRDQARDQAAAPPGRSPQAPAATGAAPRGSRRRGLASQRLRARPGPSPVPSRPPGPAPPHLRPPLVARRPSASAPPARYVTSCPAAPSRSSCRREIIERSGGIERGACAARGKGAGWEGGGHKVQRRAVRGACAGRGCYVTPPGA